MIRNLALLLVVSAVGYGCAHDPYPSSSWNGTPAPKYEERAPSSDSTADYIYEGGQPARLENCGGHDGIATMTRVGGMLYLQVRNIECAFWTSKERGYQLDSLEQVPGNARQHWANIRLDDNVPGWHEIVIGSKNYISTYQDLSVKSPELMSALTKMKGDVVRYYVPSKLVTFDLLWRGDAAKQVLSSCGGTVQASITPDRQLALVFRDVSRCNTFELLSNDGKVLDYSRPLDWQKDSYGGSRSIPKNYVESGYNGVYARIYRIGGGEDRLFIHFIGSP